MSCSNIPLLNLDNFENECLTRATPYVLTSPTSLRACAKLLIEPNELVYKSLEKYEEDLAGLPLSEIYRIYEENETERQEKLLRCRQVRRTLQEQPYEDQRKRLIQLGRIPMRSAGQDSQQQSSSQSSGRKHVVLQPQQQQVQYTSDTESAVEDAADGQEEESEAEDQAPSRQSRQRIGHSSRSSTATFEARSSSCTTSARTLRHGSSVSRSEQQHQQRTTSSQSHRRRTPSVSPTPTPRTPVSSRTHQSRRPLAPLSSSRSVPNLANKRGNLNFSKLIPDKVTSSGYLYHHASSPSLTGHDHHLCHYLCHCPSLRPFTSDQQLIAECMKRYGDVLLSSRAKSALSPDDQKILQLLLLKKGRALEWDARAQELRALVEYEKAQRVKRAQLATQKWYEQLQEKRRRENLRNAQRYMSLQQKEIEHRKNLERFLERRDQRVQNYLRSLEEQRNSQIAERQRQEALKQLEVGRAIERLLEQDQENRLALAENLQKRMHNAELRKRRKEQDHWRHIYEMNRLDAEKRALMHEQIEKVTANSIQTLRNQLEEKEARSALRYQAQLRARQSLPKDRGRKHEAAIRRAQTLHAQLVQGLNDWYKKIFELHLAAQERASQNYASQLSSRRSRLACERAIREERSAQRLLSVHEEEAQRRAAVKSMIETKDQKSARLQLEKERRVQFSRRRAQHAAELRQQLRERLDPETFDKKVARVALELRLMKQPGGGASYLKFKSPTVRYHQIKLNGANGNGNGGNGHKNGKSKNVEFRKLSNENGNGGKTHANGCKSGNGNGHPIGSRDGNGHAHQTNGFKNVGGRPIGSRAEIGHAHHYVHGFGSNGQSGAGASRPHPISACRHRHDLPAKTTTTFNRPMYTASTPTTSSLAKHSIPLPYGYGGPVAHHLRSYGCNCGCGRGSRCRPSYL